MTDQEWKKLGVGLEQGLYDLGINYIMFMKYMERVKVFWREKFGALVVDIVVLPLKQLIENVGNVDD